MINKRKLIFVFTAAAVLWLAACSSFRGFGEPAATQPSLATLHAPTATPISVEELQDKCLLGEWRTDINSMISFMESELSDQGDISFRILKLDGAIHWQFTQDSLEMLSSPHIQMLGESQFGQGAEWNSMEREYQAIGAANWIGGGGVIIVHGIDYVDPGEGKIYLETMFSVSKPGEVVGIPIGVFFKPFKTSTYDTAWAEEALAGIKPKKIGITPYECGDNRLKIFYTETEYILFYRE
ncbi:MAG: hypothetical protein OEY93_06815 [Anaerolineae bacterium]|nr:hypothetical protein [Anaerolineae bacterium]